MRVFDLAISQMQQDQSAFSVLFVKNRNWSHWKSLMSFENSLNDIHINTDYTMVSSWMERKHLRIILNYKFLDEGYFHWASTSWTFIPANYTNLLTIFSVRKIFTLNLKEAMWASVKWLCNDSELANGVAATSHWMALAIVASGLQVWLFGALLCLASTRAAKWAKCMDLLMRSGLAKWLIVGNLLNTRHLFLRYVIQHTRLDHMLN